MLLDGNSLAFRAFYALPAENFKTRGGLTTNAVYGFTAMLINLLRDEAPTHIAAAFDVSRQTFRSERYPEYKANRSSTPDEFHGQIDITKEVLGALGITVLAEPGFEADDIIATLATQAEKEGYRVLVVTGDRDSLQLVSDDVTVLYPRKGVSELTRFTPEAVVEKYGLTPAQYPDFAALRGTPATTCPAFPGWARRPPPSGSPNTARCRSWSTMSTRFAAKSATRFGRTWPTWCATANSPSWCVMCRWPKPRTRCGCSPGTATTSTGSSTTWSSGCCETGYSTRWPRSSPRSTRGSTCAAGRCSPARWRSGWPHTPATGAAAA
ncbi:5'-3' exonuclease, N-terminal resolvase-like domain protein [Mycobacterium kansasii]|uniref:5'-3' exonuclease n=1 Tax=Mycobacterium kansasii TaxID=1768 RepID=A0A1V3XD15_MYCKA|nr:5'-3' exonuclease, N-terminal resolvase-like domain protein [Mycobacterium kansasii]